MASTVPSTSRRAMLGVFASLPVAALALPGAPLAAAPDADPLERLFSEWKAALIRLNEQEIDSDAEWAALDAAEEAIMRSTVATPRVAEMRLWISLQHTFTSIEDSAAIARENISYLLAHNGGRDWNEKFLVNAIAALKGRQPTG